MRFKCMYVTMVNHMCYSLKNKYAFGDRSMITLPLEENYCFFSSNDGSRYVEMNIGRK